MVLLATACESVLIVARSGITTLDALTFAMEQLRHVRVPVTGAVLNDVQLSQAGAYAEAYDYYATASPHVADPSHSRFSRT